VLVRATLALSATQIISWGTLFYGFAVVGPAMRTATGWSTGASAGAFSMGLVVAGASAPATARALTCRGPRLVMATGSIIGLVGMLAWAAAPSLLVLYAAWVVLGVAMAATLYEPAVAVLVTLDPSRRRRTLTVLTVAGGLASTVFAPLTGLLVDRLGWRTAVAVLGVAGAAATLALHLLALPGRVGPTPGCDSRETRMPTAQGRAVRRLTVAVLFEQGAQLATTTFLVALLVARGVPTTTAASALAVHGLGKVAGRIVLAGPVQRRPLTELSAGCAALQLVALAVPLATTGTSMIVGAAAVAGAAAGATTVLRSLLVVELVGAAAFAAASARLARVSTVARAGGPFLLGAGAGLLGWSAAWWLTLAGFAVAALRYRSLGRLMPGETDRVSPLGACLGGGHRPVSRESSTP
jgi:predicted MFS family arabinose efflux permease